MVKDPGRQHMLPKDADCGRDCLVGTIHLADVEDNTVTLSYGWQKRIHLKQDGRVLKRFILLQT